jgi:hypothetical protein
MNNLTQIVIVAAWLIIPISIWGIIYYVARIAVWWHIRHNLGDMPSAEEIQKLYEQNNAIIEYRTTPPSEENLGP